MIHANAWCIAIQLCPRCIVESNVRLGCLSGKAHKLNAMQVKKLSSLGRYADRQLPLPHLIFSPIAFSVRYLFQILALISVVLVYIRDEDVRIMFHFQPTHIVRRIA